MAQEVFCCCEYENRQGERSHLLACCCDCEALDQIADRCFKCESIPPSLIDNFLDTLGDRCRIPGITGGGALRVNLELATPLVVIPTSLILASIGPITTFCVLLFLPCFCAFFYSTWKRRTNKLRTKFFFIWGLVSLVFMYILFELVICGYTRVSYSDNILMTVAVIGMLVALKFAKQDPGVLVEDKREKYMQDSYGFFGVYTNTEEQKAEDEDFEVIQMEDVMNEEETDAVIKGDHPLSKGDNWCVKCELQKPPRSGHCNVCDVCIADRDHHCVWIDSCVGRKNHRSFLVAMVMFVFVGCYGSYVTLAAVWGLCYASAWYTLLVCCIMAVGLVHQIVLISQNATSQEVHRASQTGNTCWAIFIHKNSRNNGLIQNWRDFVLYKRSSRSEYETV
ncbi:ZDH23-like protein [Mya arenaria]|uniref:Palmitoyltransferase n=1 Tax=Mya arenaria TaxID=6604 RepID=A0ABY7G9Q9_MYAAR|nr:ZDH23-like protein [Mya arenaria]